MKKLATILDAVINMPLWVVVAVLFVFSMFDSWAIANLRDRVAALEDRLETTGALAVDLDIQPRLRVTNSRTDGDGRHDFRNTD